MELPTLDLLTPLAQLIRLQVPPWQDIDNLVGGHKLSPIGYANVMRILCEAWVLWDWEPRLWYAGVAQARAKH